MRRVRSSSIGQTEANLVDSNATEFTLTKHRTSTFYLLPLFIYASLVSLQAEPMAAVVASGYSVLLQQINYAGCNQILLPKVDVWFSKDRIRALMASMQTQYLFSWGRAETDYYKIEAEAGPTPAYFASVTGFRAHIHNGGHAFPIPAVTSFLDEQLRRLRLRAGQVEASGTSFFATWNGLQATRSYEVQSSTNFQQWESALRVTNPSPNLRFEFVPTPFDSKRFFRIQELR